MHYTQGKWVQVPLPGDVATHTADLHDISMLNAHEGWAVGYYLARPVPDGKNLFHCTGGQWTPYPLAALASQLGKG